MSVVADRSRCMLDTRLKNRRSGDLLAAYRSIAATRSEDCAISFIAELLHTYVFQLLKLTTSTRSHNLEIPNGCCDRYQHVLSSCRPQTASNDAV